MKGDPVRRVWTITCPVCGQYDSVQWTEPVLCQAKPEHGSVDAVAGELRPGASDGMQGQEGQGQAEAQAEVKP